MTVRFESVQKEAVILDPQQNMAERRIPSEIRMDPLTGRTARICHFMKLQWEKPDFEALVAGTESWCPFCPDKVLRVTPCFPRDLIPEGRLQNEEMVIFPNLAPYDAIGAVATFGARHYIPMLDFTPELMASTFAFAMVFFRQVKRSGHPESVYHITDKMGIYSFNLNFFTGTGADDHFRFHLLFSPRTFFSQQLGTPDTNAMRNLFNESICMAFPEEISERLKQGF